MGTASNDFCDPIAKEILNNCCMILISGFVIIRICRKYLLVDNNNLYS